MPLMLPVSRVLLALALVVVAAMMLGAAGGSSLGGPAELRMDPHPQTIR
jgi:hypothetical protein